MPSIAPPAHTRGSHTTDDWITPRWLIERLGPFDLDPCASVNQPWPCADDSFVRHGLDLSWGRWFVWMNPPYKRPAIEKFLEKMAAHDHGIALIFARTETKMFFDHVWPKASALLFLRGRLTFCYPDGTGSKAGHNSGGPSVLIGYGALAVKRLQAAQDLGKLVLL